LYLIIDSLKRPFLQEDHTGPPAGGEDRTERSGVFIPYFLPGGETDLYYVSVHQKKSLILLVMRQDSVSLALYYL
jgi:hypothetical protein